MPIAHSGKFIFRKAAWSEAPDIFRMRQKESTGTTAIRKIFFIGVGITHGHYLDSRGLTFNNYNADKFSRIIKKFVDDTYPGAQYIPRLFFGFVSRSDAWGAFEAMQDAGENDICIVYFAGVGMSSPVMERGFLDLLFSDDPIDNSRLFSNAEQRLPDYLWRMAEKKKLHVLFVADLFRVVLQESGQTEFNLPEFPDSSFVCIQNCSPHKVRALQADETLFPDNDVFTDTLIDLFDQYGRSSSYKEIFERLVLRMSQSEETRRPKITTIPAEAADYRCLSNEAKADVAFKIQLHSLTGEWRLNAGRNQGIRPSVPVMPNIFRLADGTEVTIVSVSENHSTVTAPENHRSGAFGVSLVQQAMLKLNISVSSELPAAQQSEIRGLLQENENSLLQFSESASFQISKNSQGFFLIPAVEKGELPAQRPIHRPQPDLQLFMKELEAIARWQGLLELENPVSDYSAADISVEFEILEGSRFGKGIDKMTPTLVVTDPDRVILHYERDDHDWVPPCFRCKVKTLRDGNDRNKFSSEKNVTDIAESDIRKESPAEISVLYLGSLYSIGSPELNMQKTADGFELTYSDHESDNRLRTVPVEIEGYYRDSGIFEIYHYLKIFISDRPIDFSALWQDPIPVDQGFPALETVVDTAGTFRFPSGEWYSYTFPIKITYGHKEDYYR